MELIDGEIYDDKHYSGYIVRAHREGDTVLIYAVHGSGFPYLQKELKYSEFVKLTEGKGLDDVF